MIAKSRKSFVGLACLLSLSLCVATQGFAGDKLKVKTHIDTSVKQESNYFLSENNEEDATAFIVNPGFTLGYTTGKTDIDVEYDLKAFLYSDEPGDQGNYNEHVGKIKFKTDLTDRITLKVGDSLTYTRDPAQSDALSNAVDRNKYYLNRFTPSVSYNFNEKLVAGLKYERTDTDYKGDDNGAEDSEENKGEFNLYYNLNKSSRVNFDYSVWNRDFDLNSSEYTSNQAKVGYSRAMKYVTFMGNAGVHSREFDQDGLDDIDQFIWNLSVKAQSPAESGKKPRSHAKLAIDQNLNSTGTTYLATRVTAEAGYLFNEKIDVVLGGYFQNSDYEFSSRDDDKWNGNAKVDYLVNDMWVTGVECGYETRDSNVDGKDYDNNYVKFHVDVVYDFASK